MIYLQEEMIQSGPRTYSIKLKAEQDDETYDTIKYIVFKFESIHQNLEM